MRPVPIQPSRYRRSVWSMVISVASQPTWMHTCALLYVSSLGVQAFSAASGARRAPRSPGANADTKASRAVVAPTAIPYSFPSYAQESFRHQGDCQARGRASLDRLASAQSPDPLAGLREG